MRRSSLLLLLLLAACVDYTWVPPMRATYESVAPEYVAWVTSDVANLTSEQVARRLKTVGDWDRFLTEAEEEAGEQLAPLH